VNVRLLTIALLTVILGGCESLPHDGPSARQVEAGPAAGADYALVDLDYRVSQIVAANPARPLRVLADVSSDAPIDLIGVGDTLAVSIFEAGVGPSDAGAPEARIYSLTVDRDGGVSAPFAGTIRVAGLTPAQAAVQIRQALRGRLIGPQVLVSVSGNLSNAVTVMGEVRNAGRYPLTAGGDRLLDILAVAGGSTRPGADAVVTVVRGNLSASTSLAALLADPAENVRLAPRDQVRVTHRPRKFSTFGAFARASQISIEDETLSLAAAISRMGGLDTNAAQANAVMVFRFERPEVARALGLTVPEGRAQVPVIYRLNLREPSGLFIANTFQVQADDLIYAPRADSAELKKFFELVSSISRVAYDVTVTSVIK
jgi:polysaccharide export outer membrane protein